MAAVKKVKKADEPFKIQFDQEDVVYICEKLDRIADAVAPFAVPGEDATGGHVICLTEAVMGVTAGLCKIAESLNKVAAAIRTHDKNR